MKKMTIGCVVFGLHVSDTKQVLGTGNLDQSDSNSTDLPVDEAVLAKVQKWLEASLPASAETFFQHVTSENEVIDLPKADVYVAVPFKQSDIAYAALYAKNKPVVFVVPPYSDIWSYGAVFYPYFVRDAQKLDRYLGMRNQVYVSKNGDDLRDILEALHVKYRLNNTRALCIGEPMYEPFHSWNWGYEMVRAIQEKFGVEWEHISSDRFLSLYNEWDKEFESILLSKEAKNNFVPGDQNTKRSEKMYHIFQNLIEECGADAFTVNCLYSIVHTECGATACYALSKLNDAGIVSACEADITTLLCMMITSYASNSPCFMLNPYLFPEDNKLFVSHCTSPRKHSFGSDQEDDFNLYAYYEIPTLPCALQVLKESGPVTVTGISHDNMDKMIVIRGNIVRNTAFSSCRTQMEIDVEGDIKEIAEQYEGRHWALVYGDQSRKLQLANDILGIQTLIF